MSWRGVSGISMLTTVQILTIWLAWVFIPAQLLGSVCTQFPCRSEPRQAYQHPAIFKRLMILVTQLQQALFLQTSQVGMCFCKLDAQPLARLLEKVHF